MDCDRCGKPDLESTICSALNGEPLCMDCYYDEKDDPTYPEARAAQVEALHLEERCPGAGSPEPELSTAS